MSRSEPPRTPAVRVSGPPPAADRPAPAASRRGTALLIGVLGVAAGLAVLAQPPPAPPVDASLRVLPERIATSQSGVVVVPVEVDNRGPEVVVEALAVRAEPVRQASTASGARRLATGSRRGLVVLVQPDCGAGAATGSVASLTVVLRSAAGARRELVLDLDQDPAVAARLATLCARR